MTPKDINTDDLSVNPTAASLTALIGEDLFGKLSALLGGRRLYVPYRPGENSPITVVVGLDAAEKISHVYGGMQFEVPQREGHKFKIRQLLDEGVPVFQIANRLGVSRRSIKRVQAEELNKKQLDLF